MVADNLSEVWDIHDLKGRVLRQQTRREPLKIGEYHDVVGIFLLSSTKVILQQRSWRKLSHPGKWQESAGGSVLTNETSLTAARREASEELGLYLPLDSFHSYKTEIGVSWITHWFWAQVNDDTEVKLDKDELIQINWLPWAKALEKLTLEGSKNSATALDDLIKLPISNFL